MTTSGLDRSSYPAYVLLSRPPPLSRPLPVDRCGLRSVRVNGHGQFCKLVRRPRTYNNNSKPLSSSSTNIYASQSSSIDDSPQQQLAQPSKSLSLSLFGLTFNIPGRYLLLMVPFIWASYPICLKWLYRFPWAFHPAAFNVIRLLFSTSCFIPRLFRDWRDSVKLRRKDTLDIYRAGFELGFYAFMCNVMRILSLPYISAARSTFISQLSTIIVPIGAFATGMEPNLSFNVCVAAVIAVAGVALLTLGDLSSPFSWKGDGAMLITAFLAAAFVLRSKIHSSKVRTHPLIGVRCVAQTVYASGFLLWVAIRSNTLSLSAISASFVGATPTLLALNIGLIVWTGLVVSVLSSELQMRGQSMVSASEAVIIFTSFPLWTSLFAIPLGERFGIRGIAGAALILFSTLFASKSGKNVGQASPSTKR